MIEVNVKKKQMNIKGPTFEVNEYDFSETPEGSKDQFKTRPELFGKYMDNRDTSLDESLCKCKKNFEQGCLPGYCQGSCSKHLKLSSSYKERGGRDEAKFGKYPYARHDSFT